MKKALALVLALVLALSMAVSAFALDVVTLKPADNTTAKLIDISDPKYQLGQDEDYGTKYLVGPEGGKFYVTLDGSVEYKSIEVTANGIVDAKLVEYDPETMTGAKTEYVVTVDGEEYEIDFNDLKDSKAIVSVLGKKDTIATSMINFVLSQDSTLKALKNAVLKDGKTLEEAVPAVFSGLELKDVIIDAGETSYKYVKALANALNDVYKTSRFNVTNINEEYVYVIELTVEENYSAAYKTGSVKVTADEVIGEDARGRDITKAVSGTIAIVSDVAIFEYEEVKWAANKATNALVVGDFEGYSDYLTSLDGYGEDYDEDELRYDAASVVSTTAFRAIEGKDLTVDANDYVYVTLKEIAAGQKGVNFANYIKVTDWEDDDEDEEWDENEEDVKAIGFGFYGDQVVKGEFEIVVELPIDWYDLRELFGEKVEEDDIISYYLVNENGEVVTGKKVDYMIADIDELVEFTIEGKNKELGQYEIVLEVPAEEVEGEQNPNTGAESVVGVVAALAVVSLATAAAVSLKK